MADENKPGREAPSGDESATPKPSSPKKADPVMTVSSWEGPLVNNLKARFGGQIKEFSVYLGQEFLIADLPATIPILDYLKTEQDFDYLVDITAVDYPEKAKRFEIVWILYSFAKNTRIRVKAEVAESENPATAVGVYIGANWLEREVFDMFGIKFSAHPNMTRILMPDEWKGYPLRKDYSIIQQDKEWVQENLKIETAQ